MSRSFDSTSLTTRPSIAILPPLISSSPASIRSSVDLPQPDGPTSTTNSPSSMSNQIPWITFVAPNDFSMLRNETDGHGLPHHALTAPAVRPDTMYRLNV